MSDIKITIDLSPDTKAWLEKLLGGVAREAVRAQVERMIDEPLPVAAQVAITPVAVPVTLADRIAAARSEADFKKIAEEVTKADEVTKAAYYIARETHLGKPLPETPAGQRAKREKRQPVQPAPVAVAVAPPPTEDVFDEAAIPF